MYIETEKLIPKLGNFNQINTKRIMKLGRLIDYFKTHYNKDVVIKIKDPARIAARNQHKKRERSEYAKW